MIDLIKKIEKNLENARKIHDQIQESVIVRSYYDGIIVAHEGILNFLEDYNIITAPKSIKLSEIVNRIQERSNEEIYFNREHEAIGYGEPDENWRQSTWQTLVIVRDMKIVRICIPMAEITKWLYTLWIAGTTIIDDLEVKENE
jgi:hypothetical protein